MSDCYTDFNYKHKHVCEVCNGEDNSVIYFGHYKLKKIYGRKTPSIYAHRECFYRAFPSINVKCFVKKGFTEDKDHFHRSEYGSSDEGD